MFRFCLRPENFRSERESALVAAHRQNLLQYLCLAVASWARPEAILAVRRDQWHSEAGVLDLNPSRRLQTKKRHPIIPIARQCAPHLDVMEDVWIPVTTIRGAWDKMRERLGLPAEGQAGPKLVRRSMSTLVRRRIGEANWRQGEIMLGHVPFAIRDIYAIPDPMNLGLALSTTEEIIEEIEALAPGAYRDRLSPSDEARRFSGCSDWSG